MNEKSIYSQFIISKSGKEIPVLADGKTIESRYDPERESNKIFELQILNNDHFVIIPGIAGGHLITTIINRRKDIFVIGVESCQADMDFLEQSATVKSLQKEKNVCLCTIENLEQVLLEKYIPAFYGGLKIIEQQAWTLSNEQNAVLIKNIIQKTLKYIAADFSVQSHFGKLWMHNILSNLSIASKANIKTDSCTMPLDKTAVIFAAGPTLDKSIQMILQNKDSYYLIATDTAYSILLSYNINPDAVVSIDGQYVSNVHFIHSRNDDKQDCPTHFLFDLCAQSSAVKKLIKENKKISFFTSGHPLCSFLQSEYNLNIPLINSGAGTVTISALDYALKCGFEKILVLGADFSYVNGKPYAKGTYLDRLYNSSSTRLSNSVRAFSALEFRTPLIKNGDNSYTTDVLNSYRTSFCDFLKSAGLEYSYKNNIYEIFNSHKTQITCTGLFNGSSTQNIANLICTKYKELAQQEETFYTFNDLSNIDISLLPLISWYRNNDNKNEDFSYYYKKALKYFQKY